MVPLESWKAANSASCGCFSFSVFWRFRGAVSSWDVSTTVSGSWRFLEGATGSVHCVFEEATADFLFFFFFFSAFEVTLDEAS